MRIYTCNTTKIPETSKLNCPWKASYWADRKDEVGNSFDEKTGYYGAVKKIVIAEGITEIGRSAFSDINFSNVPIKIPDTVKYADNYIVAASGGRTRGTEYVIAGPYLESVGAWFGGNSGKIVLTNPDAAVTIDQPNNNTYL